MLRRPFSPSSWPLWQVSQALPNADVIAAARAQAVRVKSMANRSAQAESI
jgi:hypothetical protein